MRLRTFSQPELLSPALEALRARILASEIVPATSTASWRPHAEPAAILEEVAQTDPDLHAEGYGWVPGWSQEQAVGARAEMQTAIFVERFVHAARFLSYLRNFHRAKMSYRRASGSWAAIAEGVMDEPVGNGALIAAALALGFEVRPRSGTTETWLNLSEAAFSALPGVSSLAALPADVVG